MPASTLARRRNTALFSASRTALVATAATRAPWTSATSRNRARVAIPRSIAPSSRCFMSPPPDPRRTISFSRSRTSKPCNPFTLATTRWSELVPMSTAARTSGGLVIDASTAAGRPRLATLTAERFGGEVTSSCTD